MISGVTSNPVNSSISFAKNAKSDAEIKEFIDVPFVELESTPDNDKYENKPKNDKQELSFDEKIGYFEKTRDHLAQNVHVSTVLASFGALALTVAKGKNGVAMLRKVLVKGGEGLSTGIVNTWHKMTKKDTTQAISKIKDKAEKLLSDKKNDKFLQKIGNFVQTITGKKEKADSVVKALERHGLVNGNKILDFLVALGIAVPITDRVSDGVEQKADKRDLIVVAKELFDEVVAS